ncbi:hypothetical protein OIO90_005264 [Microbotryomycetes sp. JL221]|nr:hypothetical protein OIO90_005264 [Microbotryomycetes sp. JL221]
MAEDTRVSPPAREASSAPSGNAATALSSSSTLGVKKKRGQENNSRMRDMPQEAYQMRWTETNVYVMRKSRTVKIPFTRDVVNAMQMRIDALENELAQMQLEKNSSLVGGTQMLGVAAPTARAPPTDIFQGGLAINSHGELRFYGPTSSYRAVVAEYSTVDKDNVEAARAFSLTRAPIKGALPREPELPRRPPVLTKPVRDDLLRRSFEFCLSQFSLVDERKFMRDLEERPQYRTPSYSPFLLNVVLGIGCRYLDPTKETVPPELCSDCDDVSTRGDVFIAWARYMIDREWENPSVATINALALLSVYLAGVGLDGPSTMFNGQAQLLAEDFGVHLGLHRLNIGAAEIPEELVAARRDAFFATYQINVMMSMYVGRSTSFIVDEIDQEVPPVNHDVEFDPPAYRSSTFHYASKLILLASRMMNSVYALLPKISLAERQSAVPELHLALESWYHGLPGPLRAAASTFSNAPHPHIIGLNMLYHLIMITLHRPFFRRASKDNRLSVSTEKCLSAAKHIVRLVKLQKEAHNLRNVAPLFQQWVSSPNFWLIEDGISGIHEKDSERRAQAKADLQTICSALREIAQTWQTADVSANVLEALMSQWSQPVRNGNRTGTQTPVEGAQATATGMDPALDQLWNMMPDSSANISFPYLFPSWDLAPTVDFGDNTSAYDDFMSLLAPNSSAVPGSTDNQAQSDDIAAMESSSQLPLNTFEAHQALPPHLDSLVWQSST